MILGWDEIEERALKLSKKWKDKAGKERQEANGFVRDFLYCFGIEDAEENGTFEYPCPKDVGDDGYIDYYAPKRIVIEMKTKGKDLNKAYEQLKEYVINLSNEEMPQLLMVADFERIIIRNRKTKQRADFPLKDLKKHVRKFADIAGYETTKDYGDQIQVNIKASEKMAKLHDTLKEHGYEGHDLEVYLVRLLFCLFADDTGIFPKDQFHSYLENSKPDGSDLASRIGFLFEVLNMDDSIRSKRTMLPDYLKQFRYINGGLFADILPSAEFDVRMRIALLECCDFDWNQISPAIFGAMFQGVMDKERRREIGAHYTSEENILKVINPLFMDVLWAEFELIKSDKVKLELFHNKIASLKFLDPACGCGNFLIIAYRELRKLEIEVIKMINGSSQIEIGHIADMIKVNVDQFYGIEYEDFPCQIAQVGMWLMDHQMNKIVEELFYIPCLRLPLTHSAVIFNNNALTIDWEDVVPKAELNYIMGNPPFVGGMMMSKSQKSELNMIFGNIKGVGELDYVTGWYKKAVDYIQGTDISVAFVSTNSIVQGQQAVTLWKPLMLEQNLVIQFGYESFIWSNDAKGKASVHCVIVGFSTKEDFDGAKEIILNNGQKIFAQHINSYLLNAPDIFIESRGNPLSNVPKMKFGSMPRDGGGFILSTDEKDEIIKSEPLCAKWIKPYMGAREFINDIDRWCLWLTEATPAELKQCPKVMERISFVKEFREKSIAEGTRKFASTPSLFCQIAQPNCDYIAVPKVSSERRKYIPVGFLPSTTIASDLLFIIPSSSLYVFGVITSNVHNAWMRVVAGRLKSDYRYAKDIVYNTFPWPEQTKDQQTKIELTAQVILDIRANYPDSSLADLYDPLTMPSDLLRAHRENDKAVCQAYGDVYRDWKSESDCVAFLMKRYLELILK